MVGETEVKHRFRKIVNDVWRVGNRLYKTRLRRPKITWFHFKPVEDEVEDVAAWAINWNEIKICFEYAVHYPEEMYAVMIHEVAHCFSTYYCDLIGRKESDHGYLWRQTAKHIAKVLKCDRAVATHAYHEMSLTESQIKACKPKRRSK